MRPLDIPIAESGGPSYEQGGDFWPAAEISVLVSPKQFSEFSFAQNRADYGRKPDPVEGPLAPGRSDYPKECAIRTRHSLAASKVAVSPFPS